MGQGLFIIFIYSLYIFDWIIFFLDNKICQTSEGFSRRSKTVRKAKHSKILLKGEFDIYELLNDFDNVPYFCLVQD